MDLIYKLDSNSEILIDKINDVTSVSEIFLSLNQHVDEISDFLEIIDNRVDLIDKKYLKLSQSLNLSNDEVLSSLPSPELKTSFENISRKIRSNLQSKENEEYLITYLSIKRFLRSLSRAYVDSTKLREVLERTENKITEEKIKSFFKAQKDGRLNKTRYSMVGSSTGRLTVKDGPQILTLKSDARCALKSRYQSGRVMQIDLVAAEPNIALKFCNKESNKDVYGYLAEHVLEGKVSRKSAKLITLSALYGQSSKNLQSQLPSDINPRTVIKKTRDFFEINRLEKILYSKHRDKNLRNILGRPIKLPYGQERLLISYFLQSSAAEMSIMMFSNLMRDLGSKASALFVIHDALVLDCNEELTKKFKDNDRVVLSLGDWSFDAKVSYL